MIKKKNSVNLYVCPVCFKPFFSILANTHGLAFFWYKNTFKMAIFDDWPQIKVLTDKTTICVIDLCVNDSNQRMILDFVLIQTNTPCAGT